MATEFQVVFTASQHFGDSKGLYEREDPSVEFVGGSKSYTFEAPGADPAKEAVLMFRAHGVSFRTNLLSVNGTKLPLGITPRVEREWSAQIVVIPAGTLKAAGNSVSVESRTRSGETTGNLDDFLLSGMVVLYKS